MELLNYIIYILVGIFVIIYIGYRSFKDPGYIPKEQRLKLKFSHWVKIFFLSTEKWKYKLDYGTLTKGLYYYSDNSQKEFKVIFSFKDYIKFKIFFWRYLKEKDQILSLKAETVFLKDVQKDIDKSYEYTKEKVTQAKRFLTKEEGG